MKKFLLTYFVFLFAMACNNNKMSIEQEWHKNEESDNKKEKKPVNF